MRDHLCLGTCLTLLTAVKRPPSRNAVSFMGIDGSVNEPMMLAGLMKLLNRDSVCPDWSTIRATTSQIKKCRYGYNAVIPLNDPAYTEAFHERVKTAYASVLGAMKAYCDTFLLSGDRQQMTWLARALLELIELDDKIPGDAPLPVLPDGSVCRKNAIETLPRICLPALLVGCLDYIVMHARDNRVGAETIEHWVAHKEQAHQLDTLISTIGASLKHCPEVTMDIPEPADSSEPTCEVQTAMAADEASMDIPELADSSEHPCGAQTAVQTDEVRMPWEPSRAGEYSGSTAPLSPITSSVSQYFSGVNVWGGQVGAIHYYHMPGEGGTGLFELMGLDTRYYHLFVSEGENFTTESFTVLKQDALSRYIDPHVRDMFLAMGPEQQRAVLQMPAVLASVNGKPRKAAPGQLAMLGKLQAVQVQNHDVRFRWKPYCVLPQQVLNDRCLLFDIWSAPARNELDEEHWSIKARPLIQNLQSIGVDPYRLVR